MSTGIELQTMLPVINAPFRIYYAYNALRLDGSAVPPIKITPSMFPNSGAGVYTYNTTAATLEFSVYVARAAQDVPLYSGNHFLRKAPASGQPKQLAPQLSL